MQTAVKIERRAKNAHLNIIGISAGQSDSACSLLQDGVLVAAAREESLSRIRNDKSFPRHAFRYCLKQAGLTICDVDCVAYYEDPCQRLGRQIWEAMVPRLPKRQSATMLDRIANRQPQEIIRTMFGYDGPLEFVDHHLSYAAASYYFSGFEEAAILTVDGTGDWYATTYGSGRGSEISTFEIVDSPHSFDFICKAIAVYIGFGSAEAECALVELAPYGNPLYLDKMRDLVELGSEGQYRLNPKYLAFFDEEHPFTEDLPRLFGCPPRKPGTDVHQFHMDVVRSLKAVLEELLLGKVGYLHSKVSSENLCIAGGMALNFTDVGFLKRGPFKRIFVQPADGDAGASAGAAAVAYTRIMGADTPVKKQLKHVYLGPADSPAEVFQLLNASSARFHSYRNNQTELIRQIAGRLSRQRVVAWCSGPMQFGSHSLGSRSILANPCHWNPRKIRQDKGGQEAFGRFAWVILESRAREYFDLDEPSPFMAQTCRIVSRAGLPDFMNAHASALVQTVNPEANPRFAALLEEFYRHTGCPVLLDGSFNLPGEPVVCTALDAILSFVRSRLDVLVLEDFILERSGIPSLWEFQSQL